MKRYLFLTSAIRALFMGFIFCLGVLPVQAQTNTFTYQGRLTDSAMQANGVYDLQFALFDDGGTQIGMMFRLRAACSPCSLISARRRFPARIAFWKFRSDAARKPERSPF